ncbi:centrosomal protein of 63 kDa isoform X2 [Macaca mulatta]
MRLLQPCNRPCARRKRKGRARPGPEAAQAALVTLASRPHGLRPVRATVCEPPGASPPARVRPGAPSLGLARYALHTGVVRHGAARRAVRPRQTTVMSWWPSNLQSFQNKGDLVMEALLERMQNRGHGGGFLTSCEAELQELMKQIDIMVAHKKSEWEGRTHALETCLKIREQELKTLRGQLDVTHKEVGMLHQQVEEHEKIKQEMTMEYKQELKKLHEELGILKRSYEKLQKKQMREFRGNTKNHREDRSEIERLTAKIEEFRQKSLDWEKQRLIYQQQVSSLEAQRKALAEQSEIIQAQLANRKQKLESVELSSQSEIQHLSSKLERANDTICANELEIERLTMRVNDLVGTSMTVLQEQQQKEEKLRESEKLLEALQEEKRELRAALQSQENLIHEGRMQKEKLQEKVKATDTQHAVEAISLESVSATCKQLSQELMEKYEELKRMEAHNNEYRAEIKKLKEQILQGEQSYSSALEGMKMEISHLTQELHQRDISIASTKGSSSDMEKRLKAEIQKAEEKAVEHKEILDQLESLKLENRHLSEMVMKFELGLHEAKEISLADLQENYIEALNKLVSENQQLQKDLMNTKSQLEISTQMCKKQNDRIFKPTHRRTTEFKNTEFKPTHGQHRHDGIKTEHYKTGLHSPRGQASDSIDPMSRVLSPLSPQISPCSSTRSLTSYSLCKSHSLPSALDTNEANFSDTVSESMNDQEEFMSSCSLPVSPLGSIATRFLEEEELRSHHILERLDAHIEELKRESEKTVRQFTALK